MNVMVSEEEDIGKMGGWVRGVRLDGLCSVQENRNRKEMGRIIKKST